MGAGVERGLHYFDPSALPTLPAPGALSGWLHWFPTLLSPPPFGRQRGCAACGAAPRLLDKVCTLPSAPRMAVGSPPLPYRLQLVSPPLAELESVHNTLWYKF